MCTTVEEMNIEAILAVMNTAELVVKIRPAKIASMFVTFDYVLKTLHELLHDADMTHYVELKNC